MMTYAQNSTQWVHDVVENLQREHDRLVLEYMDLEKVLPGGRERWAMRQAVIALADAGQLWASAILSAYLLRLESTGK